MERQFMMPDKIVRSGISEVFDDHEQVIAKIDYQFWSFSRKLQLLNPNDQVISKGRLKFFSFRPTWLIFDENDNELGKIKRIFSFFTKEYIYENSKGQVFKIEGNIFARNFKVYNKQEIIIEVSSYTSFFSLRSHSYLVKILDENLDTYEVINIIEGIRNLVEAKNNRNNGGH